MPFLSKQREEAPVVPGAPRKTGQGLRNMELGLLVFAFIINFSALLLVQLGVRGTFDFNVVTLSAIIGALTLGVNIVLRFRAPGADPFILPIAAVLNGLGIAMIYRIDIGNSDNDGVFWTASTQQIVLTMLAVGVAIVVLILLKNHRVLQRYTYVFMAIAIVLLLLPLIPGLGRTDVAARVWISVAGFSFQPGEIAKIALAIFFAGYLVTARDSLSVVGKKFLWMRFPRIRDLGPILVVWAVCMGVLVFQRDLGTSLLYFGLFLVMVFVSTGRLSWVLIGLGLFIGGAIIAATSLSYVEFRVHAWLDPFEDEMYFADGGSGQLVTGLFGLAAGGLIGKGLGSGSPGTTPLASSDFIIAAIGEELGMAGIFVVLLLFVIFVARGFRIGQQGVDDFGRLLATGLAFTIAVQVFVVAGGVMRVIPLTGLTMPFMAAGGSSLLANWIIVAILLRLSDTVRNVPTEAIDE
ncbi:FtsW/RodA/SpoVE family cell cycle protein [Pseudoclavibacter sp. Z016]|uniref:FtsW/RodA/SpoVE family cell cycle protein n=1 Tax=Pseudoclavibacter sp. Z016 TaxID=2080581 RepID=UPI000CE84EEF|nr:FtsW/RodA/SpoVE family cell cycle protein [Pseudoclavibacter sp. Z016]PPF73570.1 cell division protein FtsW [Pseudoclavibacter sp. Z016]